MIAHGWRNTQTCIMTCIRPRPLILKNVLEMIGAKRPTIFPLRVADAISLSNGDPAILAHGVPRLRMDLLEPWADIRLLRLELPMFVFQRKTSPDTRAIGEAGTAVFAEDAVASSV